MDLASAAAEAALRADSPSNVRPLGAGCVDRRLASRVVVLQEHAKASALFGAAGQFGCCVSGAVELAALTPRLAFQGYHKASVRCAGVAFDATNGFNRIRRDVILRFIATEFPSLLPWALSCLSGASTLFLIEEGRVVGLVDNDSGVQQGDPAGPFLYACAMVQFQRELAAAFPNAVQSAYLDDLTVVVPIEELGPLVDWVDEHGAGIGYYINDKSMLIAPDGLAGIPEATVAKLDASEADGLGRLLGAPFTPTGQLGAPLSRSEEKEAAQLLRAVSAREPVLEALSRLPDTQAAWVLVRFCAAQTDCMVK